MLAHVAKEFAKEYNVEVSGDLKSAALARLDAYKESAAAGGKNAFERGDDVGFLAYRTRMARPATKPSSPQAVRGVTTCVGAWIGRLYPAV